MEKPQQLSALLSSYNTQLGPRGASQKSEKPVVQLVQQEKSEQKKFTISKIHKPFVAQICEEKGGKELG